MLCKIYTFATTANGFHVYNKYWLNYWREFSNFITLFNNFNKNKVKGGYTKQLFVIVMKRSGSLSKVANINKACLKSIHLLAYKHRVYAFSSWKRLEINTIIMFLMRHKYSPCS